MATTRELRDRISSIDNTLKITNAMYLISSTKLRKAKTDLAKTEPYFYTLQTMIQRILRHLPEDSRIHTWMCVVRFVKRWNRGIIRRRSSA